jgi:hypothetical protein
VSATVADWLQAWGTVAGAIFAAAAAIAAFLVLLHEIRNRHKDENDILASTARSVLLTTGQPHGKWAAPKSDGLITSIDLHLTNYSRSPVVDLELCAERRDEGPQFDGLIADVLGPGEKITKTWNFNPPLPWPSSLVPTDLLHTTIVFTDENGLRWERTDREQPNARDRHARKYGRDHET